MTEIIPAVLPRNRGDLERQLALVSGRVPLVHLDVEDGTLTRRLTWPYTDGSSDFDEIRNEEEPLPYWEELNFEVHLMLADPRQAVDDWVRAGAERLIVHLEAFKDDEEVSAFLNRLRATVADTGSAFRIEVGLAANLETATDRILAHALECDFVHLMSIRELGQQGEAFDEAIFSKMEKLRYVRPDTIISIDGGVRTANARRLAEAGAARLVVGSAIFNVSDPAAALDELTMEVE